MLVYTLHCFQNIVYDLWTIKIWEKGGCYVHRNENKLILIILYVYVSGKQSIYTVWYFSYTVTDVKSKKKIS